MPLAMKNAVGAGMILMLFFCRPADAALRLVTQHGVALLCDALCDENACVDAHARPHAVVAACRALALGDSVAAIGQRQLAGGSGAVPWTLNATLSLQPACRATLGNRLDLEAVASCAACDAAETAAVAGSRRGGPGYPLH